MPIIEFPLVEDADEQGLLAIGGDLHHDSLLLAYSQGIFPWPISSEYPLAWFSPPKRGIIKVANTIISKSLKKFIKKSLWTVTFNQDFFEVISNCQKVHSNSQDGTWITDEIIAGYTNFFNKGHAYSCEVRNESNEIIGGLYGVKIGHFVSGESMFYKEANASKVALAAVLHVLQANNIVFLDTQMVTPATEVFGAIEVARHNFIKDVERLIKEETFELPTTLKLTELV